MKKMKRIFWKFCVEKPFRNCPRLEDKGKSWRKFFGVAPKIEDIVGYKILGILNFLEYLAIFFMSFLLISILTHLTPSIITGFTTVLFGITVIALILGAIYFARYKLWGHVVINPVVIIGIIKIFPLSIGSMIISVVVIFGLVLFLYLYLNSPKDDGVFLNVKGQFKRGRYGKAEE